MTLWQRVVQLSRIRSEQIALLDKRLNRLEHRIKYLEVQMAQDRDALAELDAELDALEAYVASDEQNDAAEIEQRTNRVRTLLAAAQGQGQADESKAADVEQQLGNLTTGES